MMWIALCAGAALFVSISRGAGTARRSCPDAGSAGLRALGASGMFALAIAAALDGAMLAMGLAAGCAVVLTLDPLAVWRRLTTRLPRAHAATVTPFQNAT